MKPQQQPSAATNPLLHYSIKPTINGNSTSAHTKHRSLANVGDSIILPVQEINKRQFGHARNMISTIHAHTSGPNYQHSVILNSSDHGQQLAQSLLSPVGKPNPSHRVQQKLEERNLPNSAGGLGSDLHNYRGMKAIDSTYVKNQPEDNSSSVRTRMNGQHQKTTKLEGFRASMNHGSFIASIAEKNLNTISSPHQMGPEEKENRNFKGSVDLNQKPAENKKKFQTINLQSENSSIVKQGNEASATNEVQEIIFAKNKRNKSKALGYENLNQKISKEMISEQMRAEQKDQRPSSLVQRNYDQTLKTNLPKIRVSFDNSLFNGVNQPRNTIQQAYYMSLQQSIDSQNITNESEVGMKKKASNPLLRTSKISHSAKDLFKIGKQSIKNLQLTNSTQNSTNSSLETPSSPKTLIKEGNLPFIEPSRISQKPCGSVYAYATNTHDGLVRAYNEDYVAVVPDLRKPASLGGNYQSKKVSYFGLFDGHGGNGCAQYLRDNLHILISQSDCFPTNPEQALKQGFRQAEEEFMRQNLMKIKEKSGSCAIVVMIVEDIVYIANVGDSRAILSQNNGQLSQSLTQDHKPCEERERKRILESGGQLYQNYQIIGVDEPMNPDLGPIRVLPGRLSVSRTFGDPHAKIELYGGNPKVVIAQPDITHFKIQESFHDFIIIGCDGIFDRLSTEEVIRESWKPLNVNNQPFTGTGNVNEICGDIAERVIKASMIKESLDNLSVVVIAFKNFAKYIERLSVWIQQQNAQKVTQEKAEEKPQNANKHFLPQVSHSFAASSTLNTKLTSDQKPVSPPVPPVAEYHQIRGDRGSYISSRGMQAMQMPQQFPNQYQQAEKDRKSAVLPIIKRSDLRRSSLHGSKIVSPQSNQSQISQQSYGGNDINFEKMATKNAINKK